MEENNKRFYGKYRGTVVNNVDPENRGRIQAIVPDVKGTVPLGYALPCLPVAGKGSGSFFLPEMGAGVWIEFEQGDPDYPIWSGCFWGTTAEMPEMSILNTPPTPNMVFQTTGRNSLTVFGAPGGGVVIAAGPVTDPVSPPQVPHIKVSLTGITISTGPGLAEIALIGNTVTINKGALVVI